MINVTRDMSDFDYKLENIYYQGSWGSPAGHEIKGEQSEREKMNELEEELERETLEREREILEREKESRHHRNDEKRYGESRHYKNDEQRFRDGEQKYREWHYYRNDKQNYREFSTNYNKCYNYQRESFVKDSRLDKFTTRDRGTDLIVKSWSRPDLKKY